MSSFRRSDRLLARPIGGLLLSLVISAGVGTPSATAASVAAKTKPAKATTTTTVLPSAPKTFCEGWAWVREVRTTGATGITAMRMQSERYAVLVTLSPKDIRPQVAIMADYFATTLGIADKPINNQKQTDHLETLIPKIGDALTAVTRYAVRSCPRSLVLSSTTTEAPTTTDAAPVPVNAAKSPAKATVKPGAKTAPATTTSTPRT